MTRLLLLIPAVLAATIANAHGTAAIHVIVQNESGEPVSSAPVTVFRWTGVWEDIDAAGSTDALGTAAIGGLPMDQYLGVRVSAADYATTMQYVEFSRPETRELKIKLSPPVSPIVNVTDIKGNPIAGAQLQRLEFVDANKTWVFATQRTARTHHYEWPTSNEVGNLRLPPLPRGSLLNLTIIHPEWKSVVVNNVTAADHTIAAAKMTAGVRMRLKLICENDVPESLDGLQARVTFYSPPTGDQSPVSIDHFFTIKNNSIDITAYPRQYQSLMIRMDDFFVTPNLLNAADSPAPEIDLSDARSRAIKLNVRRKVKLRGRVIDQDGKPLPDVNVFGNINAISDQWPPLRADAAHMEKLRRHWASGGDATTDSNGNYEVELAAGEAGVEAIKRGYFPKPYAVYFTVTAGGETIPTITMLPVPTLRGIVKDQAGKLVPDAYLRMRSVGYSEADPTGSSKSDGSFALPMTRIPYAPDGDAMVENVYVVGVDLKRGLAGMTKVDVADAVATQNITVHLSPKSPTWVLNPLVNIEPAKTAAYLQLEQQRIDQARLDFPDGVPGKPAPQMAEGTWLNTDAKSLADFRGKHVLLDFWYIGCGPCQREMPSIQVAHQMLSNQDFAVVAVHRKGETPASVQAFADANGMDYPIVVDDESGTIEQQYQRLGVQGYPSYMLLDPEGRILHNDTVSPMPSLRQYKIERVYHALQSRRTLRVR